MTESPEYYWLISPPIVVDDSDPTIDYNGVWHAAAENELFSSSLAGNPPLFNTLHVLPSGNGSFSYDFIGEAISVYAYPLDNNTYTVQCFLDGSLLPPYPHFLRPICATGGLSYDITHTISVTISPPGTPQDGNMPLAGFALDYLSIDAPMGTSPWDDGNQAHDVYLDLMGSRASTTTKPTVNFGLSFYDGDQIADVSRGWQFDDQIGFHTMTSGSQFNITFAGVALWWYGYNANTTMEKPFSAAYIIDGGEPSKFEDAIVPQSPSPSFQFRTPVLEWALHHITVVYHGSNASLPLSLTSLIVQRSRNSDSPSQSTSGLSPTNSTSQIPSNSSLPTVNGHHIPETAGGIAGGIAFLVIVACGAYIWKRRSRRRRHSNLSPDSSPAVTPQPFPNPTDTEGTVGIRVPRKNRASQDGIGHPATQQLQPPPSTKWTRLTSSINGFPDQDGTTSTPATKQQDEGSVHAELPAHPSEVPLDPQDSPTVTATVNSQSGARIWDGFRPIPQSPLISIMLSRDDGERDDEGSEQRMASVSDLPPAYTTH